VTRSATGELETLEIPDGIPLHHKGQLPSLRGKSGVYMIIQNGATDCYIGSAIDCANRLRNHRAHFRPNKVKLRKYLLYNRIRTLGASVFTFSLLHNGTNFLELFNKTHPWVILKPIDSIFLEAFTKYELVVIEQSYLSRFLPTLNARHIATTSTHSHLLNELNTDIADPVKDSTDSFEKTNITEYISASAELKPKDDISHFAINPSLPIQVTNVEGIRIGSFNSLREAGKSEYLDVSHQVLSRYAKSTDFFFSKRLGINLYVSIANVLKEGSVQHPVSNKHNPLLHNLV